VGWGLALPPPDGKVEAAAAVSQRAGGANEGEWKTNRGPKPGVF
jgi:hypothetical protein